MNSVTLFSGRLKNLSRQFWTITQRGGKQKNVEQGRSVKLESGTIIDVRHGDRKAKMSAVVRKTLCEIIERHGRVVARDPSIEGGVRWLIVLGRRRVGRSR